MESQLRCHKFRYIVFEIIKNTFRNSSKTHYKYEIPLEMIETNVRTVQEHIIFKKCFLK